MRPHLVPGRPGSRLPQLAPAARTPAAAEHVVIDLSAVASPARRRPGVAHEGALTRMDSQMRVAAGHVADALGWLAGQPITAQVTGPGVVTVAPFDLDAQSPLRQRGRLDAQRRICLPATVRGALDLLPGAQVLLIGRPDTRTLEIRSAAFVMAELTGTWAPPVATPQADDQEPGAGRRSGPRSAWRPAT